MGDWSAVNSSRAFTAEGFVYGLLGYLWRSVTIGTAKRSVQFSLVPTGFFAHPLRCFPLFCVVCCYFHSFVRVYYKGEKMTLLEA